MADTKGYVKGDWNAYCDYCGGQYLASQLDTDYWGFKACKMDFTLPNPQMFVRPKTEKIVVPWSRPTDGTQAFTPTTFTGPGAMVVDTSTPDVNIYNIGEGATGITLATPANLPVSTITYTFTINNVGTVTSYLVTAAAGGTLVVEDIRHPGHGIAPGQTITLTVTKSTALWKWTR
jgi:hypothetical protein